MYEFLMCFYSLQIEEYIILTLLGLSLTQGTNILVCCVHSVIIFQLCPTVVVD